MIDLKSKQNSRSESADDGVGPMEDLASFLTSDPPPPLNFTCRHCSDSFEVEHDLKLHESTHTKIAGTYNCLKCKKKFRSKYHQSKNSLV